VTEPPETPSDPNGEPSPYAQPSPYPQQPYEQQPPQYGPPQYGPPQSGPPYAQQPPPYAPQYAQQPPQYAPQYAQQPPQPYQPYQAPPPAGGWEHLGPPMPPPRRNRRAPLIAAVAAVAVIGGGTASYIALSDSHSSFKGAASPEDAVTSLVSDLNQADLLGVLDHLAPAERTALLEPVTESISQAKRLHILKSSANAARLPGVDLTAKNITFDKSKTEVVNDHVKVVKLTAGTITFNADLRKVPFTDEYLKLAFPQGLPSDSTSNGTINIADVVRDTGEPVRISAQSVNGKWYPSLLYTIADNTVYSSGEDNPTPADYIAPKGAASPEDVVKQAVAALSKGDYTRLIELSSPDEMRVLHDYGGLIVKNIPAQSKPDFTVKDLQLTSRSVSGATRVSLKSITVDVPDHETTVAIDGGCLMVTVDGDHQKLCTIDLIQELNDGPFRDKPLTPVEIRALGHLIEGIPNVGVDVTSTDGQWYLNPARSYLDLSNALFEPLQDNDFLVLLKLMQR